MPPSTTKLSPRLQASLERMARQSGQARQYVTPDYDKIMASYQPETHDGGGGGGVNWGKIGGTLLKSLSVPQAAFFTPVVKGTQAALEGFGVDVPESQKVGWSAALGDFNRDKEGRTGWQQLTEKGMGLDRKAGFAAGLVLDPLWAAGVVTKPLEIAAKVSQAGRVLKDTREAAEAGTALARRGHVPEALRAPKRLELEPPKGSSAVARRGEVVKVIDDAPPLRKRGTPWARGYVSGPILSPLGPIPKAAADAVREAVTATAKGSTHLSDGKYGQLLRKVMSGTGATKAFAKTKAAPGARGVYLRLGIGEKFSKDIKLGTLKSRVFNNTRTFGQLGRSPLERGTHQVKVSNDELSQIAVKFLTGVQKNWQKSLGLSDEAAEAAAQRVGMVAIAANQSPEAAAALRATMKSQGLWDDHYDDLLGQLRSHWDEFADELGMASNKAPGPYSPQFSRGEGSQGLDDFAQMVAAGERVPGGMVTSAALDPTRARKFESSFAALTRDEAVEALTRTGVSREAAESWAESWQRFAPDGSKFADETTGFKPEFDMFKLAKWREQGQMKVILDRQINDLAAEAGVFDKKVLERLKSNRPHGPLAESAVGQHLMHFVSVFKGILTTINPSHFVRNMTGDYINHLINGNFRHLASGAFTSRSKYWRVARGDEDALKSTFNVGGVEYTGAELLVESAFMGLGRGYVGSDIAQMMDMLDKGFHRRPGVKQMTQINMNRENAVRLETYVKHRQAGDDMFTASAKTLRVHFDYSDLSDFEKYVMRNMFLFYTWLRRNSMLQVSGVLTRPGLYSAARTMEQYRPKLEGEPEYLSRLAMVGAPGLGSWNVGNPMESLHRFEPTGENFRQTVLGAVNPLARVPVELGTNRNWRTGFDISRGPGDVQPGLTPSLLDAIGIDMPQASFTGYSPGAPAMDPYWKHAIENLLAVGPVASTVGSVTRPDEPYRPGGGVADVLERILGIRKARPDAEQAARGVLAKVRDARREIDIRRKYAVID